MTPKRDPLDHLVDAIWQAVSVARAAGHNVTAIAMCPRLFAECGEPFELCGLDCFVDEKVEDGQVMVLANGMSVDDEPHTIH